ncbi:branched-chain amino acid ABC transporter permease [Mangrovactinospora gilvigrisea]|uniref:Branched-chain amino acid ABC transporter permease n=1 Tax=Mangrovactinospora gilvigrisea TaxID=1428644 RepID=A0A1J7CAD0_9ACTN|nr:branched-chain amino acid ABC transporter permease [Mangrovactinospora gilvigrisea]
MTTAPTAHPVRDGLAVGLAVGLSGFAFGVTAAGDGLTLWQCAALSALAFTGASQFALVGALGGGAAPLAAVAGALFLGVRNAFYGMRLSLQLSPPRALRPLMAHWVIDETSAVAFAQPDRRSARAGFTTTGVSLYLLWNATTVAGALGAGALGDPSRFGLDAAGPAAFLALLGPRLRQGAEQRWTAALGVVLALGCTPLLPAGVPVLATLLAVPIVLLATRGKEAGR